MNSEITIGDAEIVVVVNAETIVRILTTRAVDEEELARYAASR